MVAYQVRETPVSVVDVTLADGRRYRLRLAHLIKGIADSGQVNPLDGTPILTCDVQVVTEVKPMVKPAELEGEVVPLDRWTR